MSKIKIDIVSDVVCPWCVVGLKQLQKAAEETDTEIDIHWHPFELNPQMPDAGQNLQEHMCEKYGTTVAQSNETRQKMTTVGDSLGFSFQFDDQSKMLNTFKAHQLLHWADQYGQAHALKTALFLAYFTDQQNINDTSVLLDIVAKTELDVNEAKAVLDDGRFESDVREQQKNWTSQGITGVPAMVFLDKYLVTGAQGVENYTQILNKLKAGSQTL